MEDRYRPITMKQHMGCVIEECGELQAALGKTLRWGLSGVNPELPVPVQEKNIDWVRREMIDAERAIGMLRKRLVAWEADYEPGLD